MKTTLQPDSSGGAALFISDYRQFGARHAETGALRNVLAHLGTGEPFTEALLFGIGGGLGLGYFVYQSAEDTSLFIATRITTQESAYPGFLQTICQRLGLEFQVQHSSTAAAAEKSLKLAVGSGTPLIVWADSGVLPYYATPFGYHAMVIYGMDEDRDQVFIADRSQLPLTTTRGELASARQGGHVPRFRSLVVKHCNPGVDVAAAVRQGLRDCLVQMREGFGPANLRSKFGLRSLEKWAALLIDDKDKRGWPGMFPRGLELFETLSAVFDQIENRADGGSALRLLFADFLKEANTVLGDARLIEVAEQYRDSARLWGELAGALLPDSVSAFAETRQLQTRKRTLFERRGAGAIPEIQQIDNRLVEIKTLVERVFPLAEDETRDFLAALRDRVLAIHQREERAIASLESIMGRGTSS